MKFLATLILQASLLPLYVASNALIVKAFLVHDDFERTHDLSRAPAWLGLVEPRGVERPMIGMFNY